MGCPLCHALVVRPHLDAMAGLVPPNARKTPITRSKFILAMLSAGELVRDQGSRGSPAWGRGGFGDEEGTVGPVTAMHGRATRYSRHEQKEERFRLDTETFPP